MASSLIDLTNLTNEVEATPIFKHTEELASAIDSATLDRLRHILKHLCQESGDFALRTVSLLLVAEDHGPILSEGNVAGSSEDKDDDDDNNEEDGGEDNEDDDNDNENENADVQLVQQAHRATTFQDSGTKLAVEPLQNILATTSNNKRMLA